MMQLINDHLYDVPKMLGYIDELTAEPCNCATERLMIAHVAALIRDQQAQIEILRQKNREVQGL